VIDLHRREGRMLRVGHRGAAALAPENTIESLRLALELGCDLVEFDVHDLAGTLVLVHDLPTGPVSGLPTLDEALEFLAGTDSGVHLDLKARGAEEAVADALRRHGLVERTVISSFRPETLRALAATEPGLRLGLTYPEDRRGLSQHRVTAPLAGVGLALLRAALPPRVSGPAPTSRRERRNAAFLSGNQIGDHPLPCAGSARARVDGGRPCPGAQARRAGRRRRNHERSADLPRLDFSTR
jgi:glycerophosphoryl diester phosphodiesterase